MRGNFRNNLSISALVLFTFTLLAVGKTTQAQTGTFYFTAQGSTVPITNVITTGPGQIINLSVYFQVNPGSTDFAPNGINTFVGFDKTTSEGASAVPTDGLLILNGSASTAVSNINTAFTQFLGGQLGGGQPPSSSVNSVRPYGDDLFFGTDPGTAFTSTAATRLFDISLQNVKLTSGSETVSLYSSLFHAVTNPDQSVSAVPGGAGDDTTYLFGAVTTTNSDGSMTSTNVFVRPTTYNLTISAAPEPAETATLGLVALGLGGLMLRARKRGNAKGQ